MWGETTACFLPLSPVREITHIKNPTQREVKGLHWMICLPKNSVTVILILGTHVDCVHHMLLYSKTSFNGGSGIIVLLLSNNSAAKASTHNVWNSEYFRTCQRVSSTSVQQHLCGQRPGWVTDLWEVGTKCAPRHSLLRSKTRRGA